MATVRDWYNKNLKQSYYINNNTLDVFSEEDLIQYFTEYKDIGGIMEFDEWMQDWEEC